MPPMSKIGMDINRVHEVLNKLTFRKKNPVIFFFPCRTKSLPLCWKYLATNKLLPRNTTVEAESSHFKLCNGKMHKTNSYVILKSKETQFCQRSTKCIESLYFADEQDEFRAGFPTGKLMQQSTQGAAASPACSSVGRVQRWSHQATASPPIPGTALVVFKSWEVAGRNVTENGRKLSRRKNKAFSSPSPKVCCPKTAQRLPWRPPLKPGEKQSGN